MSTHFEEKAKRLAAFLKGDGTPPRDPIPHSNKLNIATRFPVDIWLVLLSLLAPFIAVLIFILSIINLLEARDFLDFTYTALVFAGVSIISIAQFILHKLGHVGLKRWMIVSLALQAATVFFTYYSKTNIDNEVIPLTMSSWLFFMLLLLILGGFTLYVFAVTLRRSPDVLRWFGSGQADQKHRRRIHEPLVKSAHLNLSLDQMSVIVPIKYALHYDSADQPLARRIKRAFAKVGHTLVSNPEQASRHVAIITNRSSQEWVQKITKTYRDKLVFMIGSTIDSKKSLSETGQYQWIDFRNGDKKDIEILARSIQNPEEWKRESALESTPTRINELLLPPGMVILKGILQFLGAYLIGISIHPLTIYNGMTGKELVRKFLRVGAFFPLELTSEHWQAIVSILVGLAVLWLASKALLDRKIPKQLIYLFLFAGIFYAFETFDLLSGFVVFPVVFLATLYTLPDGYHWLPGFSRKSTDEVGIEKSNLKKARQQNLAWALLLTALFIYLGSMVEVAHM